LPTILEGIFESSSFSRNLTTITEHVRQRLSRQITFTHVDAQGMLPIVTLSPEWEDAFMQSLVGDHDQKQLAMAPSKIHNFIMRLRTVYDHMSSVGESPVLVCSTPIRPYVRSILEKIRPSTIILSQNEMYPKVKIRTLGQV
jgi:flagellar biosynthesis protein FlhA